MSALIAILAGLVSGVISGFGIGGGTLLVLWLTMVAGFTQRVAQGMNLLYFLPTALAAVLVHSRKKLVHWQVVLPAVIAGALTAGGCAILASLLDMELLRKCFGGFLIVVAFYELRCEVREAPDEEPLRE